MRNLKLEDRISLNYVLLFLVLILFSNVILVYSLQRQSKKNLVSLAQNKIEDINSFLDKVTVFSRKTNELTFDFNPQVMEGGKIIYLKPFNPGEEGYLYVLEMKRNNSSAIPINTIGGTDTPRVDKPATLKNKLRNNDFQVTKAHAISNINLYIRLCFHILINAKI